MNIFGYLKKMQNKAKVFSISADKVIVGANALAAPECIGEVPVEVWGYPANEAGTSSPNW